MVPLEHSGQSKKILWVKALTARIKVQLLIVTIKLMSVISGCSVDNKNLKVALVTFVASCEALFPRFQCLPRITATTKL